MSELNNTKIKLDSRINEREFEVDYLNQLPDNFNKKSFDDKNFKVFNGESLNEMDNRFNNFINSLLNSGVEKSIVVFMELCYYLFFKIIAILILTGRKQMLNLKIKLL